MASKTKGPKGPTTFCSSWRSVVRLNLDGIDELYDWVTAVPNDRSRAKCSLCIKSNSFSISSGGIADCTRHASGAGHRKLIKERATQKTLLPSSSNLTLGLCEKDKILKAEILQALKVVDSDQSFASAA